MARITVVQVKAWLEPTKLKHPDAMQPALLEHAETEVLARVASVYDTSTWVDTSTTPPLIQTIISKMYAGWYYDIAYSEDVGANENTWAQRVIQNAEMLIVGIVDGSITIPTIGPSTIAQPVFYPNDNSSIQDPYDNRSEDTSLGPNKFSINQVF